MPVYHRTQRLQIFGSKPEVTQLFGNRYRMVVRCTAARDTEAWYNDNKDQIFAGFGTLYDAQMSIDGIDARTGEAYDNMVLVSNQAAYTSTGEYVIEFVYETLTSTWTKEQEDTVSSTENGLRLVERSQVATLTATAPYDEDDVGVSTITSGGKTLYLAGLKDETKAEPDTQIGRVVTQWIEAGETDRLEQTIGDGVLQVTVESIITQPTVPSGAYVISENNENVNGLDVFTTSYVAAKDGTGLTQADGGEKEIFSYDKLVPFIFPGVVDLKETGGNVFPAVRSPVEANVLAKVLTYYQTSSDIVSSDFTKESALGLWNPSEWCQKISHIDSFYNQTTNKVEPAYFNAQGMRGCRTRTSFSLEGDLTVINSTAFDFSNLGNKKTLSNLTLEETSEVKNGKSVYRFEYEYQHDNTRRLKIPTNGVVIWNTQTHNAEGKFTIECSWNGSQWELIVDHRISDTMPSDGANTSGNTYVYTYSVASGGYLDVYTNATSVPNNNTIVFTSTNAANTPDLADWPSGVNASDVSNEESIGNTSIENVTLGYSGGNQALVSGFGGWIEGRRSPLNANGQISIKGGPPDPLGKKYVLDVSLKKAFTDVDGTDVYQKQIVVATCTPA